MRMSKAIYLNIRGKRYMCKYEPIMTFFFTDMSKNYIRLKRHVFIDLTCKNFF